MYKHLTGKLICELNNHLFRIAFFQPFSLMVSVELEAKKLRPQIFLLLKRNNLGFLKSL